MDYKDLSEMEKEFLRRGGAVGVDHSSDNDMQLYQLAINKEYELMLEMSYSVEEVAKYLEVTSSQVNKKFELGELFAINGEHGRVFPEWQFHKGATLPNLDKILKCIDVNVNPIVMQYFFLGINNDLLDCDSDESPISPRDWLIAGYSIENVVILAKSI